MTVKKLAISAKLFNKSQTMIPGGVNSPVRAFGAVGSEPPFIQRGDGPYIYDVDGNRYIDYVCSWGPLILGHNHPLVATAVHKAVDHGLSFGAPTPLEVELAEQITTLMPNIEMLRMVNSGTEATMSAIRLARGYTGRNKIVKFDSCYHGHTDSLLVKAGSGLLTYSISGSAGVTPASAEQTLTAPYNDLKALEQIFSLHGEDIAGVIVEPIAANNNLILPKEDFLPGIRKICDKYKSILIFDEVITGFRVALGGAQALFGIKPDLTCLGKIIGGGMPVGAFGGRREILQMLAPLGPVYQAGTLSGNPIAMAAGLATIQELQKPGVYQKLTAASSAIANCFSNYPEVTSSNVGGIFGIQFKDIDVFKEFFHAMIQEGVYLAPSAYEAGFVSIAHTDEIIEQTRKAIRASMQNITITV